MRREKKVCAEETVDGIEGMQPGGDTMKEGGTDAGAGAEKTIAGEAGIKTKRGEAEAGMRRRSPGKGEVPSTSTFFYRERKSEEQDPEEVQLYVVAAMPPPPRGGDTMRVEEDHQEAAAAVMNPELEPELEQYFPEEDTVRVQDPQRQLWVNNLL